MPGANLKRKSIDGHILQTVYSLYDRLFEQILKTTFGIEVLAEDLVELEGREHMAIHNKPRGKLVDPYDVKVKNGGEAFYQPQPQ